MEILPKLLQTARAGTNLTGHEETMLSKEMQTTSQLQVIFTFCVGFWSLSKAGQDCLLLGILLCFVLKKYYNRENNSKTSCDFQFESKAFGAYRQVADKMPMNLKPLAILKVAVAVRKAPALRQRLPHGPGGSLKDYRGQTNCVTKMLQKLLDFTLHCP